MIVFRGYHHVRQPAEKLLMVSLQYAFIAFLGLVYHIVFYMIIDDAGNDCYHYQHHCHDAVGETLVE